MFYVIQMSNKSPDPIFTLRGHSSPITTVEFVADLLFSGSSDGEIFAWDLETFRKRHTLMGHGGKGILWIDHTRNTLLTQGRDGTVATWALSDNKWDQLGTIVTNAKGFCQCHIPRTLSSLIAAPSEQDWKITVWDLETRKAVASTREPKERLGMAMCIRLCDDCSTVLTAYENGSIVAYDLRSGGSPITTVTLYTEPIMCMDFYEAHEVGRGICGSMTKELCEFERHEEGLLEKRRVSVINDGFCSVHVRPDGKIVASGGLDGRVRVFSWKTLKPLAVLDVHKESVQTVRFSKDKVCEAGSLLAAGSKDRTVSLWSLYN